MSPDKDKRATMEGDRQGVRRTDDWLAGWSRGSVARKLMEW